MTLPAWPAIEYRSQQQGWSITEPFRGPIVTEMEDGPDRIRARSLTPVEKITYRMIYNDADLATFRAFVLTTLNQASQHFTIPVYVPGSGGTGYVSKEAWFSMKSGDAPYTVNNLGGTQFEVIFTLAHL